MRQRVIVSGKGGTGKTSLVAALARLSARDGAPVVLADCDVDAANLALLLPGTDPAGTPFVSGRRAAIDEDRCVGCGLCAEHCRFGAVTLGDVAVFDPLACEGCGVCALVCPSDAVTFRPNLAGVWMERALGPLTSGDGSAARAVPSSHLVHALLGVAQDSSGKLVAQVRERARELALERGIGTVLIDGPPGIGCPVHAALTGCDDALVVTEPTPSGVHDLRRLLELLAHFDIPASTVVNKWDLSPDTTAAIERHSAEAGAPVIGRIPFDADVPRALARGEGMLQVDAAAVALEALWRTLGAAEQEPR